MREVRLNDTTFEVRPLKRGEVKRLKNNGFNLVDLDPSIALDAMDMVFSMVFTKEENEKIDELPNPDALKLWQSILVESFGSAGEEKN